MPVYRDEKTGKYYAKFYYENWQGEKKQKLKRGFARQKDAKEFERKFLEQFAKNPDISFETLYDKYVAYITPRVRESTLETRKTLMDKHILPYFKNRIITDITPSDVVDWQNEILSKNLSSSYANMIGSCLNMIFNYAVDYHGLKKSPSKKSMGSAKRKKIAFWTPEEYKTFIECLKDDIQYFTIFEMLYYTGMRIGELLALTLEDVNFSERKISITKTYYRTGKKELINPPKTQSSEREIEIPQFLADELKEYTTHLYDLQVNERLFVVPSGAVRKKLIEGAEKAGVKKIRIHDLRHSHASLLINLGANILLVSKRLGHESPEITLKIYAHLFPTVETDIINKISKL